jgi:hypothetical protein
MLFFKNRVLWQQQLQRPLPACGRYAQANTQTKDTINAPTLRSIYCHPKWVSDRNGISGGFWGQGCGFGLWAPGNYSGAGIPCPAAGTSALVFQHAGKQKNQNLLELNNVVYSHCSFIDIINKSVRFRWFCVLVRWIKSDRFLWKKREIIEPVHMKDLII